MCEVGGGAGESEGVEVRSWVSFNSKRMPPTHIRTQSSQNRVHKNKPGNRWESLIRNMSAKSGKWFRHASKVSNTALRDMMAMREHAKVR